MLISSAILQARPGKSEEATTQVLGVFAAASKATGVPFAVWSAVAGLPFGSFVGSARVANMAEYLDAGQKMAADPDFRSATRALADTLAGPTQTALNEVIAVAGEVGEPKPLVIVTVARLNAASLTPGLEYSTRLATYAADATGVGVSVAISKAGPMFQVSWLSGVDTGAQVDEAEGKLNGDAGWLAMIESGAEYFIAGSTERALLARIG